MDLYFQGRAWFNKGLTPEYMAQARGFFERALAARSLKRRGDGRHGVGRYRSWQQLVLTDDRAARLAAAETAVDKGVVPRAEPCRGSLRLGLVQMFTNRVAQGIAECEQALALDRNLA